MVGEVTLMRSKLLIGACLALAACATTAPTPGTAPGAGPVASSPVAAANNDRPPVGCVNGTGTRLPVSKGDCTGFGSMYAPQQLNTTGTPPYLQNALQMLDPAVRASGGVP
jgi:hypothetical protein